LTTIVELVEKFIQKLGVELALAGGGQTNPSTVVVRF
jgi:hypothetical protein